MKKHVLLSATAIAALLAGATTLSAQEKQEKGAQGQASHQQAPSAKSGGGSPAASHSAAGAEHARGSEHAGGGASASSSKEEHARGAENRSSAGAEHAKSSSHAGGGASASTEHEHDSGTTTRNASGASGKSNHKSAQNETKDHTDKSGKIASASESEHKKESTKSASTQDKNRDKAGAGASANSNDQTSGAGRGQSEAQRKEDNAKTGQNDQMRNGDNDRNRVGQNDNMRGDNRNEPSRAEVRLDDNNRSRFVETIRHQNIQHVRNPHFNVQIGTRIPRSVHLYTVPAAIYSFAPAYRNYRYFVVDGRICIVDPSTYEIVYVVDEGNGMQGHSQRAERIDLTGDQQSFLLSRVDEQHATTHVRLRLALGAQVPNAVELIAFSDDVVDRIPQLRDYRYVVADRNVLIVDPDNRDIVFVIRH